jgi:AcrR family transcriptional regulator
MTMVTSLLPLRERKKRDTRHRILLAGLDAFTARGFENCTIDEIARAAGVGKGTVYNYFRTKEDLVVSFMVDMERQMQADAETLAQARGSVASILSRFIESQMALKAPHYPFVRLFLAQLAGRATHADRWVGEASTALDPPLVQLFEKLQKRGLVRTDVDVTTLVGTFKVMQLGLMVLWAIEGPPWTGIGEIVRTQVRLFCSGIHERNGPPSRRRRFGASAVASAEAEASRRSGERVKRV